MQSYISNCKHISKSVSIISIKFFLIVQYHTFGCFYKKVRWVITLNYYF